MWEKVDSNSTHTLWRWRHAHGVLHKVAPITDQTPPMQAPSTEPWCVNEVIMGRVGYKSRLPGEGWECVGYKPRGVVHALISVADYVIEFFSWLPESRAAKLGR